MDGLEAIRHIQTSTDQRVVTTPIIALTALAMPGDRQRCLASGANEYLSKPVRLQELLRFIQVQLKYKSRGQNAKP
jgi:CheY-like chemotaxis protein